MVRYMRGGTPVADTTNAAPDDVPGDEMPLESETLPGFSPSDRAFLAQIGKALPLPTEDQYWLMPP